MSVCVYVIMVMKVLMGSVRFVVVSVELIFKNVCMHMIRNTVIGCITHNLLHFSPRL